MSSRSKLAVCVVAVLLVCFLIYRWTRPTDPTAQPLAAAEHVAPASATPQPLVPSKPAPSQELVSGTRTEVSTPAAVDDPPKAAGRANTLFYGSLLDASGQPLIGLWSAGVSITDAEGRRRFGDAKDSGAFAFHAIPYGKYWVSVSADGYRPQKDLIELDAEHSQLQKDYTLGPIPLVKVRVINRNGAPLFADGAAGFGIRGTVVLAVATKERPGEWFKEVVGSLNNPFGVGQFWNYGPRVEKLPKGYMGILVLRQDPPVFVSLVNYHRVLQTQELKPGQDEVEFVLGDDDLARSLATIKMQVIDGTTQNGLEGARATLSGGPSMGAGSGSDSGGSIVIAEHEPGEFDLRIQAKGHETYMSRILAEAGTITDLGRIVLDADVLVEAKVVDAEGMPRAERFTLGVYDPATGSLSMEKQHAYQSKADGTLSIGGLGRRIYVIRSNNHDAVNDRETTGEKLVSGNVLLDLRSGAPPRDFTITLVPATRMMLVVKGGGAEGLRYRVTDDQGKGLVGTRCYGDEPRAVTLPPGAYKVALLDSNQSVLSEQAVTLTARPLSVELSR